jgi:hypothetical protein
MPQTTGTVGVESIAEQYVPVGVHLVGSVPLGSAEEVFRAAAGALGDRLRRMPDGETGPRSDWILWQYPVFSAQSQFEVGPPGAGSYRALPQLRLRGHEPRSEPRFDDLGYASAAIASYRTFARLKRDGIVPAACRFLVSLPTPLAPVSAFVALEHRELVARVPLDRELVGGDRLEDVLHLGEHPRLVGGLELRLVLERDERADRRQRRGQRDEEATGRRDAG